MPDDALNLDELERLLGEATRTPWHAVGMDDAYPEVHGDEAWYDDYNPATGEGDDPHYTIAEMMGGYYEPARSRRNAALIVAAVNAMPRLIAIARAAEKWDAAGMARTTREFVEQRGPAEKALRRALRGETTP